jgi:hypothetical protein
VNSDGTNSEPENPLSELMVGAAMMHELYRTYVEAGFTEQQALYLVGQLLTANIRGQQP